MKTTRRPRSRTVPAETIERAASPMDRGDIIEMVPLVLQMRKILVPIDFSEASLKALRYAVPFARQFGAEITLLHVVGPATFPQEASYTGLTETKHFRKATKDLEALSKKIPNDIASEAIVETGIAFDTIANVARKKNVDLIIATTRGLTGLKHAMIGSTAERIVRHAPCPVMVVRDHEHEFV